MTQEKLKLLCNGIASVADALDASFTDVADDMNTIGIMTSEDLEDVLEYMENH